MKTGNKAALDALDRLTGCMPYKSKNGLRDIEAIRAALTHEDAPVGEVGDSVSYALKAGIKAMNDYLNGEYYNKETGRMDTYFSAPLQLAETALRTHSQQKDVGKLVEAERAVERLMLMDGANMLNSELEPIEKALAAIKGEKQ